MYVLLVKFCLGVIILLFSTQALVKLAEKISRVMRISPLIIGITIVALGTSLPELAVSVIAVIKKDAGLAFGNIIGSNIVNIFMVLPAGILIGGLRLGTTKTQRNALILLGATAFFLILQLLKVPFSVSGLCLLALALLVTIGEYELGVRGRNHEDAGRFNNWEKERFTLGKLMLFILSVAGVVLGGIFVVASVEEIAIVTGFSTTILGLSLTAVATSLPELLATILTQEEHQEKITIGNIIGSNIYNLLFIGGIVTLFSAVGTISTIDWVWLIFATIFFVFILRYYRGRTIPRWVGIFLLLLFFIYLLTLLPYARFPGLKPAF